MGSTPAPGRFLPGGIFQSLTQQPASHFSVGDVPAPTALYIGADSFLRLQVQNISGATSVTLHTRMLRSEDGVITQSEDLFQIGQTGGLQTFFLNLTEGFLLSAMVTTDVGNVARGLLFVAVELCHGNKNNLHRDFLLIQDYVAQTYAAAWPGGMLRLSTEGPGTAGVIQTAGPGGGFDTALQGPLNARVVFVAGQVTLTTSAVVGNRFPAFAFFEGGNELWRVSVATAIPASTVAILSFGQGVGAASVSNNVHALPIPVDMPLIVQASVRTVTTGLLAGDNYGVFTALAETWVDA
jgi:hypothetical protein